MATKKTNESPSEAALPPQDANLPGGINVPGNAAVPCDNPTGVTICNWPDEINVAGPIEVRPTGPVQVTPTGPVQVTPTGPVQVTPTGPVQVTPTGAIDVNLRGANIADTAVQALWQYIRERSNSIQFDAYRRYINDVLCRQQNVPMAVDNERDDAVSLTHGVDAYQLLHTATEAFLILHCMPQNALAMPGLEEHRGGGRTRNLTQDLRAYFGSGRLPYIDLIVDALDPSTAPTPFCDTTYLQLDHPCFVELLWSYWLEEGGLVQAINAVSLRFQNKRGPGARDPLANLELHPLRPLSNLLWGYVQDDDHRLTIARRAYEYRHQYGLPLVGKAVPRVRPADERSNFLEAFHTLLHQVSLFYERASNLTVRADGFPILNALREVHLLLAEGAHNQFRDLTWTARVEMLIQQWLLSRREMHDFLGGRPAVPFTERWMAPVDSLGRLLGWRGASITHFRDLAVDGEQILLSIRYGNWSVTNDEEEARGWAQFWKPEIQRYIHSYQAVTGVDLSASAQTVREINAIPPAILLQQRAARQRG